MRPWCIGQKLRISGAGVSWQICHAISVLSGFVLNIDLLKDVRGFYCVVDKGLGDFFVP